LVSAKLIAPPNQNAASPSAEPGDAIQLTFQLFGGCTPDATHSSCDTTGTAKPAVPLAGVTQTLSVDHGFFTPNCVSPQATRFLDVASGTNDYANCTFNATPAAGTKVGDLKSSGTSTTVRTDDTGQFVVTLGIGKDSAFDSIGSLTAAIKTDGGLVPLQPGGFLTAGTPCTAGQVEIASTGVNGFVPAGPVPAGCQIDQRWTTNEQPLNGGTAKIAVQPSLSSPNNVAIITENNAAPATGTTAVNVPDVERVVFDVTLTDQFGNLTSNLGAAGANAATLTKTGPGKLWNCGLGALTSVNACTAQTNGGRTSNAQQADGTFTEAFNSVASYTSVAAQNPYQVDTAPNAGPANTGYGTVTPSVNDGTTKVVLSWTAPTTTFASFIAGSPNTATYAAGNGAAQTDTLTLNFYNQLSQPVVTFAVSPGNTVGTSTAVTVTATVKDQNGNPIVMGAWPTSLAIQVVRSGGNESSCTPIQDTNTNQFLFTNTSGTAGYTFSCDKAGLSTVTMVVTGPGGVALASGHEAITFTGAPPVSTIKEKPGLKLTSPKAHRLRVSVTTHPTLKHKKVNVYRVVNGIPHLIGALSTGSTGKGHLTIKGLKSGKVYRIKVLVKNVSSKYHSVYSKTKHHVVK
jgi:hypothetical protein